MNSEKLAIARKIIFDENVQDEYENKHEIYKYLDCWEQDALNRIRILLNYKVIDEKKAFHLRELLFTEVELKEHEEDKVLPVELVAAVKEMREYHLFDNGFDTTPNNGLFKNNWKTYNKLEEGEVGRTTIDSYHYNWRLDDDKEAYYQDHINTDEENEKTDSINKRIEEYIRITEGEESAQRYHKRHSDRKYDDKIHYREGIGYISIAHTDRDEMDIYGWGQNEEEVFINAVTEYAFRSGDYYEYGNRQTLREDFKNRFPNEEYCGVFYFVEYAFKQLKRYYGDNIPEIIVQYLEKRFNYEYRFDYNEEKFVKKEKNLEPQLIKPED